LTNRCFKGGSGVANAAFVGTEIEVFDEIRVVGTGRRKFSDPTFEIADGATDRRSGKISTLSLPVIVVEVKIR
jgi:hypothetical protein